MPTSGRASASLPSVAIITTIRSVPNVPLHEQPLFAKLVPSLSRTITAGEKSRMRERMHLVLCAREDDTFYLENAKNVSRALRKPLGFMYPKIFYYPSLDVSLNEAMLYAYAIQEHQVQFLHRTFEDVQYAREAWLGDAMRAIDMRHVAVARPAAARTSSKASAALADNRPTVVSRRHLDIFEEYHPPQLRAVGASVNTWLLGAYGTSDGASTDASGAPLSVGSGGGVSETRRQQTVASLVACARHVISSYDDAAGNGKAAGAGTPPPRASCVAHVGKAPVPAQPTTVTSVCKEQWCVMRRRPARAHLPLAQAP